MPRGIESLFPLAAGIMLLLLVGAALLAATVPVAVLVTGILYFAGGFVFGGSGGYPGISLIAPFAVFSAFLVGAFGFLFLLFPLLAGGGIAAGGAVRRSGRRGAGFLVPALLWCVLVALIAFLVVPVHFHRLNLH